MKKQSRSKHKQPHLTNNQIIWRFSLIVAALIILGGLIYYFNWGTPGSSAFEQLPNSLTYYVATQSGVPGSDAGGSANIHYAKPGEVIDMYVTVKNLSPNPKAQVWYPKNVLPDEGVDYPNAHVIGVGTTNPVDNQPSWLDATSFVLNGNRLMYYDGPEVNKGKYVTLVWRVKVASNASEGVYNLDLNLIREQDGWGTRVYANSKTYPTEAIRWIFKVSSVEVYGVHARQYPDGQAIADSLVYQKDISSPLESRFISYNFSTGQNTQIGNITRNAYDAVHASVVSPYLGIILVVRYNSLGQVDMSRTMAYWGLGDADTSSMPGWQLGWDRALWSPDGKWAVAQDGHTGGIYLYDSEAGTSQLYYPTFNPWAGLASTAEQYINFWWSPDSSRVWLQRFALVPSEGRGDAASFDQLWVKPDQRLEPAALLTMQQLSNIKFDLYSGIAMAATAKLKAGTSYGIIPPSSIKLVDINRGVTQTVAKSSVSAYRVEAVSPDGSLFAYSMINNTNTRKDNVELQSQTTVWVSRVNDIYQPILVSQSSTATAGIEIIGFSQDNHYLACIEHPVLDPGETMSVSKMDKLKVLDLPAKISFDLPIMSPDKSTKVIGIF